MSSSLVISKKAVKGILDTVKNTPIIAPNDFKFLQEKGEHLATVLRNTHMWRTDIQKRSILSDLSFPTVHGKFHQAMLEQKVQFEQSLYLAKEYELKILEMEELACDLEDLNDAVDKRSEIKKRKLNLELQFKEFELNQMKIAMEYRMKEVRGWQDIQESLLEQMRAEGVSEDIIWSKDSGELKSMFLVALTNLQSLNATTDSAERHNLLSLATFVVKQAQSSGLLEDFKKVCNTAQLDSLKFILNNG